MALYAVIATTNPTEVGRAVTEQYGASPFAFGQTSWFVSDSGTSRDVSDKLGITSGTVGAEGIVLLVTAYSGYARSDTWTWLAHYPEARPNG